MIVVLLGPPGVGKGTQGARLAHELGWRHLSTGDLLREHRREGTELGRRAQARMDAGELVPDELILAMVAEELEALGPDRSVIFDGFPRTVPQAEGLAELLDGLGRGVDSVLLFEAEEETLVRRLSGRRSCPACGAVYNVHFNPPAEDGTCDRCGQALVHRADDDPDTVRNRLAVYQELTEPLVRWYRDASGVRTHRVDAEQPVERVYAAVKDAVEAGEAV